jgi:DNA-binding transcriptional MerR regulator
LLRMANALGIDVDYSTLRFWQKRGLVPRPTRGRVSSGRGTRGYYDPSLIDRLSFIREIQKLYAMNLDAIRDELNQIDDQFQAGKAVTSDPFKTRLAELQVQHDLEAKRTLATVLYKALGLEPGEIAAVTIQKINGQVIQILPDKF